MKALVDTGPLVGLIDRGQFDVHRKCSAALTSLSRPLLTTWPCFTEAMYFLGTLRGWSAQESLWRFLELGALRIHMPGGAEIERMKVLMEKYSDIPMDVADASLVAAAETQKLQRVFTLDSDFRIYRVNGVNSFEIIP